MAENRAVVLPRSFALGDLVDGRYRLGAPVPAGVAHEIVYAEDVVLDASVLLELRSPAPEELEAARFQAAWEVDLSSRLPGPHRLRALASGVVDRRVFVVHEAYDGATLEQRLREGRFTTDEVGALVADLARGLFQVHRFGFVHHPLTPARIVLADEPHARVTKLASFSDGNDSASTLGPYAPPEVWETNALPTALHDLYALAMLAYRAITGALPSILASDPTAASVVVAAPDAVSLSDAIAGFPLLADWFAKALASDPASRFDSAMEAASSFAASITPASQRARDEGSFNVSLPSAPRSFTPTGMSAVRVPKA